MNIPAILRSLEGKLIASCQAPAGDAFFDSASMARFAVAAIAGGAAAIRANGPDHIAAIRRATSVPILGIDKSLASDGKILITPSLEGARRLVDAGAGMIALDVTLRGQRYGALARMREIREQLKVPVLADISTSEEAIAAAEGGADGVLSTMRGYTPETSRISHFDASFIQQLTSILSVPVIAEGRIHQPEQAARAIAAGAFAVVVGTAITRPAELARRFAAAIARQATAMSSGQTFLAIDLGGTKTKFGIVAARGKLLYASTASTPALLGREVLLNHLRVIACELRQRADEQGCAPSGLGLATAGWVDVRQGTVAYATENLPGWTGTPLADELRACVDLPVTVENDANAFAIAEKHFGAGQQLTDFVSITLGTGVGGGCFTRGALNRGSHYFANALGHIQVEPGGRVCTCGQRGCLEAYCNATALLGYAGGSFTSVEALIAAAARGKSEAVAAMAMFAKYLARGCSTLVQLLDPQALILAGGIAQENPLLIEYLRDELAQIIPAWGERKLSILASPLGYYGGVLGAAAVAKEQTASLSSLRD